MTHPQHNPVIGCGWIKRGKEHQIQSNTGRQRLNINGAINVQSLSAEVRFDETIDAASTIALFKKLEQANPTAISILVICDNARYYKSQVESGCRVSDDIGSDIANLTGATSALLSKILI